MAAQVDHRNLIQLQGSEVGFDPGPQLLGSLCANPVTLLISSRTDLRNKNEFLRVGV